MVDSSDCRMVRVISSIFIGFIFVLITTANYTNYALADDTIDKFGLLAS
jgi:hypothetical protein